MKQKITISILSILLLGSIVFSISVFQKKNELINRQQNNISAMQDSIKLIKTKNGTIAKEMQSILASSKEIKEEVFVKDNEIKNLSKELKKVKFALSIKQTVRIDTIKIPMDSIGEVKTDNYSFSYFMNDSKREILNLEMKTKLSIVGGIKSERTGWFKTTVKPTVIIQSSNKNIEIEKIVSQQSFEVKDKSYRWALPIGFVLGVLVAK